MARGRNSFTPGEIMLLAYICNCLLQSKPPSLSTVQKHPEFQSLARKCISMKQQVAKQRKDAAEKAAKPKLTPGCE